MILTRKEKMLRLSEWYRVSASKIQRKNFEDVLRKDGYWCGYGPIINALGFMPDVRLRGWITRLGL